MTSLAIARRRVARRFAEFRVEAIAFAVVLLAGLAIGVIAFMAPAGAAKERVTDDGASFLAAGADASGAGAKS